MTYKAKFVGGVFDKNVLNYKRKVGANLRFNYAGNVWEYNRVEDHNDYGVYEYVEVQD